VQDVPVARDPTREDPNHGSGETGVGDHDVRPAGEQQHIVVGSCRNQLVVGARLDEPSGGPSEPKRRVVRQQHA
jgi:hypothetical protein